VENHALFPNRTNVEFIQILGKNEIAMRVWERGVGETSACGTGACASVVAANLAGLVGNKVKVHLPGGILNVEYSGNITLIGEAEKAFEGEI
ncbi:MAG: diaminopimelate epimerase, partial [Candidatus Thermoplasmatota archaeon]|nr:diaminopimelate epimerase [Candidatus Thermoplasmatota archaeon]